MAAPARRRARSAAALSPRDGEAIVGLLALGRLAWGAAQMVAPGAVASALGRPGALSPTLLRMKGGRDLAMGVGGVLLGSDVGARRWAEAGLYVDVVDTAATLLDGGRSLRPRTLVLGALAGAGAALASAAALVSFEEP